MKISQDSKEQFPLKTLVGSSSSWLNLKAGAPQSSILGYASVSVVY